MVGARRAPAAPRRARFRVELEEEDDLASGEEVTAESVRPNGSSQRPLRGSLTAPAPQTLVVASQASFDEPTEEARDLSPVFEIWNRQTRWSALRRTDSASPLGGEEPEGFGPSATSAACWVDAFEDAAVLEMREAKTSASCSREEQKAELR